MLHPADHGTKKAVSGVVVVYGVVVKDLAWTGFIARDSAMPGYKPSLVLYCMYNAYLWSNFYGQMKLFQ